MAGIRELKIVNLMDKHQRQRFGEIIKAWLDEHSLSQRAGAKLLGVSASAVRAWVNAENAVNWEDFERIAVILGKTPEALMAEVRGVALSQMPAELPYQDIQRIASELPLEERTKLIHALVESLRSPEAPVKQVNGKTK